MISVNNQRGFTLIELMMGMFIACIVTFAAMSLYVTSHKELIVQDQIADLQSNVRAATEVMGRGRQNGGE